MDGRTDTIMGSIPADAHSIGILDGGLRHRSYRPYHTLQEGYIDTADYPYRANRGVQNRMKENVDEVVYQ